jgi:hypothetical protein
MHERIRFDLPFQRNSVWKNDDRRSYLVDSIIRDRYIPNILVWNNGDGYIWVIDGRQRWESVFFFADGEYKLSNGTADFNGESMQVNDMTNYLLMHNLNSSHTILR